MTTRIADEGDYPAVQRLFQEVRGESFVLDIDLYRETCASPGYLLLVAESENGIVGVAVTVVTDRIRLAANTRRRRYHLDQLIVREDCRRQGIGKALLCRLSEIARENVPSYIIVNCDFTNVAARRTYEAAGFHLVRQSADRFEAAFS